MKKLAIIITTFLMTGFCVPGGIYDYEVVLSNGHNYSLSGCQGKKIMIVVLPATQTADDTAYLMRLDSIGKFTADQLSMIAVPSFEEGFPDDSAVDLSTWYQNTLDSSIILTQGMYTHRSSPEQHALFSWLTHASVNGHFDEDIGGPGQMYFINEKGELYGVFLPESKWSDDILTRMLQQ